MPRPGFYNDNANRYYPFIKDEGDGLITRAMIVDCGFIMGPGSGYIAGTHSVWLGAIVFDGGVRRFYFRSDAPGLDGIPLVFTRNPDDPPYTHEHADNESGEGSLSESVSFPCEAPLWSGYLVTGELSELSAGDGHAVVEPSTVRSLINHFAHSINLANGDRTRFSVPDGCNPQCHTIPPQDIWVRRECLQGPIRFKEGYNLAIRQDSSRNAMVFDAVAGGGLGEPCDQVPVYVDEVPPDHASNYDGAIDCFDCFRSINGVNGPNVNIASGDGVRIEADPDNNKLTIDVDMSGLAICTEDSEDFEYSSLSPSDPCDCGEI